MQGGYSSHALAPRLQPARNPRPPSPPRPPHSTGRRARGGGNSPLRVCTLLALSARCSRRASNASTVPSSWTAERQWLCVTGDLRGPEALQVGETCTGAVVVASCMQLQLRSCTADAAACAPGPGLLHGVVHGEGGEPHSHANCPGSSQAAAIPSSGGLRLVGGPWRGCTPGLHARHAQPRELQPAKLRSPLAGAPAGARIALGGPANAPTRALLLGGADRRTRFVSAAGEHCSDDAPCFCDWRLGPDRRTATGAQVKVVCPAGWRGCWRMCSASARGGRPPLLKR